MKIKEKSKLISKLHHHGSSMSLVLLSGRLMRSTPREGCGGPKCTILSISYSTKVKKNVHNGWSPKSYKPWIQKVVTFFTFDMDGWV